MSTINFSNVPAAMDKSHIEKLLSTMGSLTHISVDRTPGQPFGGTAT